VTGPVRRSIGGPTSLPGAVCLGGRRGPAGRPRYCVSSPPRLVRCAVRTG